VESMASSSSVATAPSGVFAKGPFEQNSREVPKLDGFGDDDVDLDDYHGHLHHQNKDDGFTRTDAREMKRMGKKQEMRVRD